MMFVASDEKPQPLWPKILSCAKKGVPTKLPVGVEGSEAKTLLAAPDCSGGNAGSSQVVCTALSAVQGCSRQQAVPVCMQAVEGVEVVRGKEGSLLVCQADTWLHMTPCSSLDCTAYTHQTFIGQSPDGQECCSLLRTTCICASPSRVACDWYRARGRCSEWPGRPPAAELGWSLGRA